MQLPKYISAVGLPRVVLGEFIDEPQVKSLYLYFALCFAGRDAVQEEPEAAEPVPVL